LLRECTGPAVPRVGLLVFGLNGGESAENLEKGPTVAMLACLLTC